MAEKEENGTVDLNAGIENIEREREEGLEYFDMEDLENFCLPSHIHFYSWDKDLNTGEKYNYLSDKGFKVSPEWLSDEEGEALIQSAYFLAENLPFIATLQNDYLRWKLAESSVRRALRALNSRVDERVIIKQLSNSYSLGAYMSREDVEDFPVDNDDMLMLRDIIWRWFVSQD